MPSENKSYQNQVDSQINQYSNIQNMHEFPWAAQYISNKYVSPRFFEIFEVRGWYHFYANHLKMAMERTGQPSVISLGAGDCTIEVEIAKILLENGVDDFSFTCLELSPILIEKGEAAIAAAGLQDRMRVLAADMNRDIVADEPVAGVMAHHALHHFVELEKIFAGIVNVLHAEGTFVTVDVVGRNGHMRWPETLRVIHEIWKLLPDRYRWDHIFQRYDRWYENLDCSTEGFEGIRAQDILPLLAQSFNFEYFYANYGLVDVFIEKRFAANFSPERPVDSLFLDFLQELEEKLIEEGKIKPIQIFAVMRSLSSKTCPAQPRLYKNLSPKFAIREPRLDPTDTTRLSDFTPEFAFDEPQVLPEIAEIPTGTTVPINDSSFGERLLRWGWFPPEGPFTWTSGHDSAIEFQTRDDFKRIELEILPCSIISKERRSLFVSINGVFAKQVGLSSSRWQKFELVPPGGFRARGRVLLEFYDSRPRQPDIDEGPDRRQLGFALASITLR